MRKTVLPRAPKGAAHERSFLGPDHQPSGRLHQGRSSTFLELPPEVVRAPDQRDVHRMLEVHLADDAAVAVRRAVWMTGVPAFDAKHAHAAGGKMCQRGAAHRAGSGYDDVEGSGWHVLPEAGRQVHRNPQMP